MAHAKTRTFRSGNSEAVRLPKEVAFGEDGLELTVIRTGDVVTIYPARNKWQAALARLAELPPLAPEHHFIREPFEAPLRFGEAEDECTSSTPASSSTS